MKGDVESRQSGWSEQRPCKNPVQQRKCTLQNLWDHGLVLDDQPNIQLKKLVGVSGYSHMSIFVICPVHYKQKHEHS